MTANQFQTIEDEMAVAEVMRRFLAGDSEFGFGVVTLAEDFITINHSVSVTKKEHEALERYLSKEE